MSLKLTWNVLTKAQLHSAKQIGCMGEMNWNLPTPQFVKWQAASWGDDNQSIWWAFFWWTLVTLTLYLFTVLKSCTYNVWTKRQIRICHENIRQIFRLQFMNNCPFIRIQLNQWVDAIQSIDASRVCANQFNAVLFFQIFNSQNQFHQQQLPTTMFTAKLE